ncbi:MAG: hypothetical protein ACOY0T_24110 [Myxococcota bacterium]
MKQRLVLAAVLATAALPAPAYAQAWLSDRRMGEGMGIRTGNLELHPGIGAEFGYDSNYLLAAKDPSRSEDPLRLLRLRITPSLSLSTLGPERRGLNPGTPPSLNFRLSVYGDYSRLFAVESKDSERVKAVQNPFNLGANLRLDIMPQRVIGEDIYADFQRVAQPTNQPNDDVTWNRDAVRAGAGLTWRPGGGLFEWRFGYEFGYNYFESQAFRVNNNFQHAAQTRGRWRFLPRTALMYDAEYRFIRYPNGSNVQDNPLPHDGDILRARVGLNGLVLPRLALLGLVGWGTSFYENVRKNSDTILATVEAKYFVIPPPGLDAQGTASTGLSTIAVGLVREVGNSYLSSYFIRTGGYASLVYFQGGAFVAQLDGGFYHYDFPQGWQVQAFSQNRINARLFAEYRFSNSFGLNGTVAYDQNMSDQLAPAPGSGLSAAALDNLDFARWQAFIGLRWFM